MSKKIVLNFLYGKKQTDQILIDFISFFEMMIIAFFLNLRNLFLSSVLKEIQIFFLLRVKYSIVVVSFLRKIRKTKQKLVSFF